MVTKTCGRKTGVEGVNPHQPGFEKVHHPTPAPAPAYSAPPEQRPPTKPRYKAIYDYSAADDDEVSFVEGDYVTDANIIDDGWMEGRIERTGQFGMIPANYVEKV